MERLLTMCTKATFKQVMTMADKGHVLSLLDEGKSFKEVSVITGYNPKRFLFLVEGLRGTEARLVALTTYNDRLEEEKYDKPKDSGDLKVRDRSRRVEEVSTPTFKESLSRTGIQRSKDPVRSGIGTSKGGDTVRGGTVVDLFRTHRDYRGE